jgi:Fur family ferric uptake transcriptional regulator
MAKKPSPPDFSAVLRSHGLRRTGARVSVLRFMHANARPVTHGEVAKALEPDGLDYATVYRNLIDLAEVGILARTDLGDHLWRFEIKTGDHDTLAHPHFVCEGCGGVTCLPENTVKVAASRKTPRAMSHGKVAIQLKGLCDDCS